MKTKTLLVLAWCCALSIPVARVHAQSTAFTYQGQLNDGSSLANGSYDLRFALFSAASGSGRIGPVQDLPGVAVSNGLFTVTLDFGANFPGANRWLEVSVRPAGTVPPLPPPPFTALTPRLALLTTPYAITAGGLSGPLPSGGLVGNYGNPISFTSELTASGGLRLNNGVVWLRGGSDTFHGLRYAGGGSPFAGQNPDGPVLFGWAGGVLGSREGGEKAVLNWKSSGRVGIGTNNPQSTLHVAGTVTATAFTGNWEAIDGASAQAAPNRGYLATGASQVDVTLPSAPALGDVVRVSGVGAGGWRIFPNPGQTVRLDAIAQSGSAWVARESSRSWTCVAASADGSKLFAGFTGLNGGAIVYSADSGATWLPTKSPSNVRWRAIACSADGSKVVAAPEAGNLHTSTNSGDSWTIRTNVSAAGWTGVASSDDGAKLVATDRGDASGRGGVPVGGNIFTSTDSGATWTSRDSRRHWTGIASSSDGTKLVAAATRSDRVYTSVDSGLSWMPRASTLDWLAVASSADGTRLFAVDSGGPDPRGGGWQPGRLFLSQDSGVTWTTAPDARRQRTGIACSADGTRLVTAVEDGQIYISTDSGSSWAAREAPRAWRGVASSADGRTLVAVAEGDRIYTSTSNVTSNTGISGGQDAAVELQHIGGGVWRILSHAGTINWQ